MKIKLFNLLLAMAVSSVIWAVPSPVPAFSTFDQGIECSDLHLVIQVDLSNQDEASINAFLSELDLSGTENLTCTVSATISIGGDKIFAKASATVTVSGDCDEVVNELKQKIAEVKEALK